MRELSEAWSEIRREHALGDALVRYRKAKAAAMTVRAGVQMNETEAAIMAEYEDAVQALAALHETEDSE